MEESRFDRLTISVASSTSRRRILGGVAGAGLARWLPGEPGDTQAARPVLAAPAGRVCRSFCENCFGCEACYGCCFCGTCRCPAGTVGVAGGGTVHIDAGEATLVLFATIMRGFSKKSNRSQVLGRVQWRDAHYPLTLDSTQVTAYGPPAGDPNSRRVQGLAHVNGHDGIPFHLLVSGVESSSASITLDAGDHLLVPDEEVLVSLASPPSGISYTAKGTLINGGLELLSFEDFKRPNRKGK